MTNLKFSELKYLILPGRFCPKDFLPIYESAFHFWYDNWVEVFKTLNCDVRPNPDDFFRQDFIPVLMHGNKIVAIHLYTLYDLRTSISQKQSYLQHNFNPDYFKKLSQLGIQKAMSMEAFFVNPEYRKSKTGIRFSTVVVALGQRVFQYLTDADAIIGSPRRDNKVSELVYEIDFEPVVENIEINGIASDLVTYKRKKRALPAPADCEMLIEHLWTHRKGPTGLTQDHHSLALG